MKVIVFGISGKIGHKIYEVLSKDNKLTILGTTRNINHLPQSIVKLNNHIEEISDVRNLDLVNNIITKFKPNTIINAIGVVKQRSESNNLNYSFEVNSLWPHHLVGIAKKINAYVIQISSDCVFSGSKGFYKEIDTPDPKDIYGQTKWMGELHEKRTLTIRTSTIGHEIDTKNGLIEWFLSQKHNVNGFSNAIFSGISTLELAHSLQKTILPNIKNLKGIFHLAANPINKYDLLIKVANRYNKKIDIIKSTQPKINRSLDSSKFTKQSGYRHPDWNTMIKNMYQDYQENNYYSQNVI